MEVFLDHNWDHVDHHTWNQLVQQASTNTIFQTFQWHSAWWQEFGRDHDLFLIRVVDNLKLVGLAPLMIEKKGGLKILKFIGTAHTDYCDFIYAKENKGVLKEIFRFLTTMKSRWDAMALDQIPCESPTAKEFNSVCADEGLMANMYSRMSCPAIIANNKDTLEKLTLRKSLQRHYHHFQKIGAYEVLHLNTMAEIMPFFEIFLKQHVDRWETTKYKSLFIYERNQRFYKNLMQHLCPHQWLNFTVVQSKGQPIAFHFGLTYGKRFIWYKPSFNRHLAKFSPGEVLLRELFIYSNSKGFEEFDFTIGEEPFKLRFANLIRKNCSFKVFKTKRDFWLHQIISAFKFFGRK